MRSLLTLSLSLGAAAQWSANPLQNLAVADGSGDQAVPKIGATRDGGCYLAWFDHRGASHAVYLQRLDAAGVEQWPHGGLLVSGHPQNDGAQVRVLETSLGPIQHEVRAMRVRGDGSLAGPVRDASLVVSEKLRLQAAASPSGVAMLCWSDRRAGAGDVYAQNVNPDGSLAILDPTPSAIAPIGLGNAARLDVGF